MNHLFCFLSFWLIYTIFHPQSSLPTIPSHFNLELLLKTGGCFAWKEGNFDAFVMAKGIKADDIEALLSGNLKLDEAPGWRNGIWILTLGPWWTFKVTKLDKPRKSQKCPQKVGLEWDPSCWSTYSRTLKSDRWEGMIGEKNHDIATLFSISGKKLCRRSVGWTWVMSIFKMLICTVLLQLVSTSYSGWLTFRR